MNDQRTGIVHRIDATWTPEQAAAVYECLSALTETILSRYGMQIHEFYKHDRSTGHAIMGHDDLIDDQPELPF